MPDKAVVGCHQEIGPEYGRTIKSTSRECSIRANVYGLHSDNGSLMNRDARIVGKLEMTTESKSRKLS